MGDRDQDDRVFLDAVEILSRTRSSAESRVRLTKALAVDGELDARDLRALQVLYDEARADVNAGLDRLVLEIETSDQGSAETYERVARSAAGHVAAFLKASDAHIRGDDRGLVETAGTLVGNLVKALVDVWKHVRGERTARRALLAQRIEALKWREFGQIA